MKFDNLGEALHTALRKCCDSSPTSAAWNLLYELKEEQWAELLEHISKGFENFELKKGEDKGDQLGLHLQKVVSNWEPWGKAHLAVALHCVFECFSDNDWYGFASFLEGVIKRERKPKAVKKPKALVSV